MPFWVIVLLAVCGFFITLGVYLSYRASLQAQFLFKSLDKKYEDFVRKSISSGIVEDESYELDIQPLMIDILTVIKPDIDAIVTHINSTDLSDVRIKKASRYFKNAAKLSEEFYDKRHKNKTLPLSDSDKERFLEAFKDAIVADLTQRKLDLRLGKL